MTIWIINQYAIPPSRPGGTRHYTLARELIQRGHRVTLIASSFEHITRQETRAYGPVDFHLATEQGVPFLWLRIPPYAADWLSRLRNMLAFAQRVWRGVGQSALPSPDVIIGSSPHLFGALAAFRRARRCRARFVFEVRDLWPESLVQLGHRSRRHPVVWLLGQLECALYRRADLIIPLLPGAAPYITQRGGDSQRILHLPNGVDFALVPHPQPERSAAPFVLMYAGALGIANGMDALLDAAGGLQRDFGPERLVLRIVGDGPERPRLQARARAEDLRNVRFESPVPKQDIYRRLSEANAFILTLRDSPLYAHGMSLNKLFDFMATARPIVFGAKLGHNPVAIAGAGVVAEPENPAALVAAAKRVMTMAAAERWQMGLRGRRYVEEHHNFAHLAKRLETILSSVICRTGETACVASASVE